MAKKEVIQVNVRFSPELHAVLTEFVQARGLSLSAYCEQATILEFNRDILNPNRKDMVAAYFKAALQFAKSRSGKGVVENA